MGPWQALGAANGGDRAEPGCWGPTLYHATVVTKREKQGLSGFLEAEACHVVCITRQVIDRLPSPELGANWPNWCSHWDIVCLSLWSQNLRPSCFCNGDNMLKRWWSSIQMEKATKPHFRWFGVVWSGFWLIPALSGHRRELLHLGPARMRKWFR